MYKMRGIGCKHERTRKMERSRESEGKISGEIKGDAR